MSQYEHLKPLDIFISKQTLSPLGLDANSRLPTEDLQTLSFNKLACMD